MSEPVRIHVPGPLRPLFIQHWAGLVAPGIGFLRRSLQQDCPISDLLTTITGFFDSSPTRYTSGMSHDDPITEGHDLSAPHLQKPHIRHFLPQPGNTPDGQQAIRVHDPLQLSQSQLIFGANALPIIAQFRGEKTIQEIADQFQIPLEKISELVVHLENHYLLWGPCFEERERQLKDELDVSGLFPRGVAYALGEDPAEVRAQLDEWLGQSEDPELEEVPLALVVPHLDFRRGWPLLGTAYKSVMETDPPDRILLLGSNHFGIGDGVIGASWTWETPLGVVPRDESFAGALQESLGEKFFADALDHIPESSVQAQLIWIQHCIGDVPVSAALIPDPLVTMIEDDGARVSRDEYASAVKQAIQSAGGRTLIICSSDLSHVGPRFGEADPVDDERRAQIEAHDRQMLGIFMEGDSTAFVDAMRWGKNLTRWCSIGNMSLLLDLVEPGSAIELLDYRQACQDHGNWMVTGAACAVMPG